MRRFINYIKHKLAEFLKAEINKIDVEEYFKQEKEIKL